MTNLTAIAAAAAALTLSSVTVAHAASPTFTFFGVEFQPRDERVPLAQAYLARTMAPGEPMSAALLAAKKAGARCGRPDGAGMVECKASSMQHRTGHDLDDIMWTVRLTPAADGTLRTATVTRTVAGL